MAEVDTALVAVNLTGSMLSLFGTSFILLCLVLLPQQRHIRHALILNLTIADFINSLNNTTSGLWVLTKYRNLSPGRLCTVNGFIGQLSIQAVDFSILIITIVTLWIVTSSRKTTELKLSQILIFIAVSWIVPIVTSFIALFTDMYGPAASNWCWIKKEPIYARYALTHGWRFVIIAIVTAICIYIQIHLRRQTEALTTSVGNDMSHMESRDVKGELVFSLHEMANKKSEVDLDLNCGSEDEGFMIAPFDGAHTSAPPSPTVLSEKERKGSAVSQHLQKAISSLNPQNLLRERKPVRTRTQQQQSIQRAMLLHAYPIFYILLWLPGISMRIAQATGHDPYILEIMQASTQFIGFANAVTFGWNERIGRQLDEKIYGREYGV